MNRGADRAAASLADPEGHRHRWTTVDFVVEAGHPWVALVCACGAVRRIRAFERSWSPDAPRPTPTEARAP